MLHCTPSAYKPINKSERNLHEGEHVKDTAFISSPISVSQKRYTESGTQRVCTLVTQHAYPANEQIPPCAHTQHRKHIRVESHV